MWWYRSSWSPRRETAVRSLRPKIRRNLDEHLVELLPTCVEKGPLNLKVEDDIDL